LELESHHATIAALHPFCSHPILLDRLKNKLKTDANNKKKRRERYPHLWNNVAGADHAHNCYLHTTFERMW
uniref:Ovule protein n=1 Tax=Haemonchus placei TaxID=6290 RepID=A0A0N4WX31_HAEPC